jgi:nucleoside-diphosphate-sugar epimerase
VNVLVTGAFGNIGRHAVEELRAAGHRVRALSHDWKADRHVAARWDGAVDIVRGDVRNRADLDRAMIDQDVVVHLAFIIPPDIEQRLAEARAVNVDGTANVIAAALASPKRPRLAFASTLDVFGYTQHLPPPRRATDPVHATDEYSGHKIQCEEMVRKSGLEWSILRFADVPPIAIRSPHPMMYRVPLAQRIEVIHPRDAGLAVARLVDRQGAWQRVLLIGGGPRCQLLYGDYLNRFLEVMGIGRLPERLFSTEPYCTDWLDTEEGQRLLEYQRFTFEDVVRETAALLGWRRPLARLFGPLVRRRIARLSPYR